MIKQKSHWWWLTIFAHPHTSTSIYPHIYLTRSYHLLDKKVQRYLVLHEQVHLEQQKEVGLVKYLFLYLFVLPFFWNPWRYKWEMEAFEKSGLKKEAAKKYLESWHYGFLFNK